MKKAFSLVELSIVLVILGLLVGGILAGQSLIHAAELRAIASEQTRFVTSVNAFRDKYMALPGDMKNATSFWAAADSSTGNTAGCVTASSTTATCNGNGDNLIALSTSSNEIYRFWQQLALAGLVEGAYDGITHGSTDYSTTRANAPQSKYSGNLWQVYSWGVRTANANFFDGTYNNSMIVGLATADTDPQPSLKPEDAWNIDTKLDDGAPGNGKVRGRFWGTCTNATSSTNYSATYKLDSTSVTACQALFINQF